MSAPSISALSRTLLTIQQRVSFGCSLFFLIFGVTGCILNIALFSRQQFRRVSCCSYFLAASIAMFIQLGFSAATTMYASFYEIPINYIPAFCKLWYYILQATSIMYRWMLAIACIDRYFLSSTNPSLRQWAKTKYAYWIIILNVLISMVFPIHILVMYDARGRNCSIFNNTSGSLYTAVIAIINTGLIPVITMIIFTWLIRNNLKHKQQRRQMWVTQQSTDTREQQAQQKRDQQALKMLFVQIIVFIIIITPWLIYNVYHTVSLSMTNKSLDLIIMEGFLTFLTGTLALFFAAISFYLYTLTSNMFRHELLVMMRSLLCFLSNENRENHVEPTPIRSRQNNATIGQ